MQSSGGLTDAAALSRADRAALGTGGRRRRAPRASRARAGFSRRDRLRHGRHLDRRLADRRRRRLDRALRDVVGGRARARRRCCASTRSRPEAARSAASTASASWSGPRAPAPIPGRSAMRGATQRARRAGASSRSPTSNFALGRVLPDRFPFPLERAPVERALGEHARARCARRPASSAAPTRSQRASSRSRTPAWPRRSSRCRSRAASIRATARWSASAAPAGQHVCAIARALGIRASPAAPPRRAALGLRDRRRRVGAWDGQRDARVACARRIGARCPASVVARLAPSSSGAGATRSRARARRAPRSSSSTSLDLRYAGTETALDVSRPRRRRTGARGLRGDAPRSLRLPASRSRRSRCHGRAAAGRAAPSNDFGGRTASARRGRRCRRSGRRAVAASRCRFGASGSGSRASGVRRGAGLRARGAGAGPSARGPGADPRGERHGRRRSRASRWRSTRIRCCVCTLRARSLRSTRLRGSASTTRSGAARDPREPLHVDRGADGRGAPQHLGLDQHQGAPRLLLRGLRRRRRARRERAAHPGPSRRDGGDGARGARALPALRAGRRDRHQRSLRGRLAPARRHGRDPGLPARGARRRASSSPAAGITRTSAARRPGSMPADSTRARGGGRPDRGLPASCGRGTSTRRGCARDPRRRARIRRAGRTTTSPISRRWSRRIAPGDGAAPQLVRGEGEARRRR